MRLIFTVFLVHGLLLVARGAAQPPDSVEFFETKIRPVLVQHCYHCHNSAITHEAGLRLDYRQGLLSGGDSGPIISIRDPEASLLLQAISHQNPELKMPPDAAALGPEVVRDFSLWIAAGATDPRDDPPTADQLQENSPWELQFESRKQWWSFQPLQPVVPPNPEELLHPIDQFIQAKLAENGFVASQPARTEQLIRRLYFVLLGLLPDHSTSQSWCELIDKANTDEQRNQAISQVVDNLLNDVRFGERWARHWMDWIRYAESHGSEGDPDIQNAWMYRDYLIRALNGSVPIDQMIREHLAGDLIDPRIDPQQGWNESLIATAHWRMVFHGFSPTDAHEERIRFIDDQINTFSKAFLGVTVSCARCHDHKFDPISQKDYYALYGVFSSCRPGRSSAESAQILQQHRSELSEIKPRMREVVVRNWMASIDKLPERLIENWKLVEAKPEDQRSDLEKSFWQPMLALAFESSNSTKSTEATNGRTTQEEILSQQTMERSVEQSQTWADWDMTDESQAARWYRTGIGLEQSSSMGDWVVAATGDSPVGWISNGGICSRLVSDKDPARLTSPNFNCQENSVLWVLAEGDSGARVRYVVQNYPRDGTVFPTQPLKPGMRWYKFEIGYWAGDSMHVELTTARDAPLLTGPQERSWFRVDRVCILPQGVQPQDQEPASRRMIANNNSDSNTATLGHKQLLSRYAEVIEQAVRDWGHQRLFKHQAELLNQSLQLGLLPSSVDQGLHGEMSELLNAYREREAMMIVSTRIPCLEETNGSDAPLLIRGDHRRPDQLVPRRFLQLIDPIPFDSQQSGRLELTERVLSDNNPLTRRVLANRIWYHLFGAGLVATPDNFGHLGAKPTHPELLDWLANRLQQLDWSFKTLIREIVLTQTWQRDSLPTAEASQRDPSNLWLSHAHLRRYEAEVIRDVILQVAGNLDRTVQGPPQPLDGQRRSVYLPVMRNALPNFLRTFDFPEPFSTVGRRDQTNVPAQSLALMNDPFVIRQSEIWADQTIDQHSQTPDRVRNMWRSALARQPTQAEIDALTVLYQQSLQRIQSLVTRRQEAARSLSLTQEALRQLEEIANDRIDQQQTDAAHNSSPNDTGNGKVQGSAIVKVQDESLRPLVQWRFDAAETNGRVNVPLKLVGQARVADGALLVSSDSYAVSQPLPVALREKTMMVTLQLTDLEQRGGGAISLQSADGNIFDAIVYGEQTGQQWLAGSNLFARTQSFSGEQEQQVSTTFIHLAIAYDADGTIRGYRNGLPYGKPYRSSGIHEYPAGQAVVALGLRHLPATGNRSLNAKIRRAELYDRSLNDQQILAIATGTSQRSLPELLQAMTVDQRQMWESQSQQAKGAKLVLSETQQQLFGTASADATAEMSSSRIEQLSLAQVARTIITLKEFLYVP